jgi:hypothetical protein
MQQQATTTTFGPTRTSGWITFAGVMTVVTGGLNLIDGLVALYRTSYFRNSFLFGDLRLWSIVFAVFGALQVAAGFAILGRQGWGRWFGLATVSINAFIQLFAIGSYPLYAIVVIVYDAAVFYALSVHWQRRLSAT